MLFIRELFFVQVFDFIVKKLSGTSGALGGPGELFIGLLLGPFGLSGGPLLYDKVNELIRDVDLLYDLFALFPL
jgi:hypothetical protein